MMRFVLCLALLLLSACGRAVPAELTELTYATPYPPSHPFSLADQRWIDFVEQRSAGRLRIRPIWSGALLSADMSMEELRHGVADIGLITPIYVRGGTHLIRVQSGFYSGADSFEAQLEVYRCLQEREPQIARELQGLQVLAVQGGLLPGVLTRDRPVRNLEDLRGMRLRAPTELLPVLQALGADPVNMPMGEVYSALAKGVIDGVIAPPDTFRALHFAEVARHYYELRVPRGAYPARAMGADRWHALEGWQRDLLQESRTVWEAALADEIRRSEGVGRQAGVGRITHYSASGADQARFDEIYLREGERNARALSRFGIDGISAFRLVRSSVVDRDQISCGGIS